MLDDRIVLEDEPKIPGGTRTCILWQTSINDQRPKLKVQKNNIIIEGLLDTGEDVTINTP